MFGFSVGFLVCLEFFFPFRSILITFLFASIFDPLCLHTTLSVNRVGVFTHRGLRFPLPRRRRRRRRRIFGLLDLRAIFNRFFRFLRGFGSFSFPFSFPLGFFSPDLSQVTNSCVSPLMYVPKSLIFFRAFITHTLMYAFHQRCL